MVMMTVTMVMMVMLTTMVTIAMVVNFGRPGRFFRNIYTQMTLNFFARPKTSQALCTTTDALQQKMRVFEIVNSLKFHQSTSEKIPANMCMLWHCHLCNTFLGQKSSDNHPRDQ